MMKLLKSNRHSILFYGIAITSVMVLFSVTTTYGEANLKAAPSIAGRYPLSRDPQSDSNCLKDVIFRLDQSGRYLTAAIVLPDSQNPQMIQPQFSGTGSNDRQGTQIRLYGTLPGLPSCYAKQSAWVQGSVNEKTFTGQLILADGTRLPIRSQREDPKPTEKNAH